MKIIDTVGMDMSKLTFDVRIHKSQAYKQFENINCGFRDLLQWVSKNSNDPFENIILSLNTQDCIRTLFHFS
jgi:transposase